MAAVFLRPGGSHHPFLRPGNTLKILGLVFSSLGALGQASVLGGSRLLSTLGSRRGKSSICTQLGPARGTHGQLQQPCSSSFRTSLPPPPPLPSLLLSVVSLSLPRMPKEPNSSFSCATDMHTTPTMCPGLV